MRKPNENTSNKPRKRTAFLKVFKFLVNFATSLLIIGFAIFVTHISNATPPTHIPKVDGIVVLTGADGSRLLVGADLLQRGYGEKLLISGVNPSVKPEQIQGLLGIDDKKFTCCVNLDYEAENTIGNGRETANWAHALGYEKILLVTSSYHMPRAILEINAASNGIEIIAYPVKTERYENAPWWGGWRKIKLLVREYAKLLVSFTREPGARPNAEQDTHI